jgi:DNA/RNA endonuclease G (NUC1)
LESRIANNKVKLIFLWIRSEILWRLLPRLTTHKHWCNRECIFQRSFIKSKRYQRELFPKGMNHLKTSIVLFLMVIVASAMMSIGKNHTVVVKHKYYKSTFDTQLNYPVKVEYWLTRNMHVCSKHIPRPGDFKEDPQIGKTNNLDISYVKSGYDRGHNFPAYDGSCDQTGMCESFYYTNMTPQAPGLNRGGWKSLEENIRKESELNDSIYVATGSIQGISTKTVGGNGCPKVAIPASCWKAYWVKKTGKQVAYLFPNSKVDVKDIDKYLISVKQLEKSVGKLF